MPGLGARNLLNIWLFPQEASSDILQNFVQVGHWSIFYHFLRVYRKVSYRRHVSRYVSYRTVGVSLNLFKADPIY